jgi:hypothetical protein
MLLDEVVEVVSSTVLHNKVDVVSGHQYVVQLHHSRSAPASLL